MIPDKKQIWVIFLSKFNMGRKAAETTCNINSAFGPGTANECTRQWWVKKFCKGDENLEHEQRSGQAWDVDSDQLGRSWKMILYNCRCSWRAQRLLCYGCLAFVAKRKCERAWYVGASWAVSVLVFQFCPTLCNPMDCSPTGSSVHGILQARVCWL